MSATKTNPIEPSSVASSEVETRRVLRKFLRKIDKTISGPTLLRILGRLIDELIALEDLLKREHRRRSPSNAFAEMRRSILLICEGNLGPFAHLEPRLIVALDKLLDGMIKGLDRPIVKPVVDAADFVALQKKIMVTPKKRGPKLQLLFDEAHRRFRRGETVRSLAEELFPHEYQNDPDAAMQRIYKAFSRRKTARSKKKG